MECAQCGQIDVTDVHGQVHNIGVHDAWQASSLSIRTIDLKRTYKQVAVASDQLRLTFTCMHSAEQGAPVYYQNLELPC
eukprot:4049581-Amphidinium_carterae.1